MLVAKKNKAFTLVELLAVIVILAIILAIAVPGISNIVNNARRSAFESDVKMIISGIEAKVLEADFNGTTGPQVSTDNDVDTIGTYGGSPSNYTTFEILDLDPITINLVASSTGKFAGFQTGTGGGTKATPNVEAIP